MAVKIGVDIGLVNELERGLDFATSTGRAMVALCSLMAERFSFLFEE